MKGLVRQRPGGIGTNMRGGWRFNRGPFWATHSKLGSMTDPTDVDITHLHFGIRSHVNVWLRHWTHERRWSVSIGVHLSRLEAQVRSDVTE